MVETFFMTVAIVAGVIAAPFMLAGALLFFLGVGIFLLWAGQTALSFLEEWMR